MDTKGRPVTTGQIYEIVQLRRAGAPIEAALRGLIEECSEVVPPPESDLADGIAMLITLERNRGPFGNRVQEIIARLTDGGVASPNEDVRRVQAKRYWDKGFGRRLSQKSFEGYLATIPEIPASLVAHDPEFPLLTLVDPRLGIAATCKLIGIRFEELGYKDGNVAAYDTRHETPKEPFWVRLHDGRVNRNLKPNDCREKCVGDIYAMTAMVGVCAYLHHPNIVGEGVHILDLPGSVPAGDRGDCACLGVWHGRVKLRVRGIAVFAYPGCGSGCFRRE